MAVNIKIQTIGDDKAVSSIKEITAAEKEQKKAFDGANESFKKSRQEMQKVNKEAFNMKAAFGQIKKAIISAAIFEVFKQGITEIGKTSAAFQKLEATLTTALGSRSKAQEALRQIREFAAVTPFQVDEIGESFNKLANRIQGIKFDNNQFTALGDLASATGKELDQLIEAILDVNNTERWNELGIKVKTEGDKITGSFKGVTKTFERTEEGALAMAQAFGEMEGVAGGMALQAATLGGQYSNLIDNTERLKLVTGERLNGVFSDTISLFNQLVTAAADYIEIPLSEQIEKEQTELNILSAALINTADEQGNLNLENGTTAGLIEELNSKYPNFLANLDQEALNVNQVTASLKEANQEYVRKIILQQQEERLTEIAKEQVSLQQKLIDLEKQKEAIRQGEGKTAIITNSGNTINSQDKQLNVNRILLERTEKDLAEANQNFADAINVQDELFTKFNINKEKATESEKKQTKATTNNTSAKSKQNDEK